MFAVGEKILYSKSGVCEVLEIGHPDMVGFDENKLYYTLRPVGSTETIFIPTDSKVFMRPVMTEEEAKALINRAPEIGGKTELPQCSAKELPKFYESFFESHSCEDLVRLISILRARADIALQSKKKVTQTDLNYMRNAKVVLLGELAVALGKDKSEIEEMIIK